MQPNQLQALLHLLDDPDPFVQSHIESAILQAGQAAVPLLEQKWLETADPQIQQRIEELLDLIQLETVGQILYEWRMGTEQPLFPALLQVARLSYPSLNIAKYTAAYRRLVHTTWLQLPSYGDTFEKLLILNRHLFVQERFQPETVRPNHPRYYFIHEVLDTRRGNTFSLTVLYYLLASELEMQVSVVSIGNRYLIRYFDGTLHFYIDPYKKGFVLLANQLMQILQNSNLSDNLAHYASLSHPYLILRLTQHLEEAYRAEGKPDKQRLYAALRERIDVQI
ncbi:MAG: transglutaminase-like domain-containing protein [Bacteroidia bacterium]|nr:transglutaminase-like domain-containing protein [Bacteroidia bacterium]MDW8057685.1 transglutaminase family protein [Bacteroidia bacterium]